MALLKLCECGRRLGTTSRAAHARKAWVRRAGHDLCEACWRRYYAQAQSIEASRTLREGVL